MAGRVGDLAHNKKSLLVYSEKQVVRYHHLEIILSESP